MRRLLALVALVLAPLGPLNAQPSPALKIVVVEGEGGVNIIQQKTAVRPLIEVRDRNNVPVAGASVTFTIAGGGGHAAAFAGGAQTLTVTTNAAGQAVASGFNALSSGAFQIQVSAAYQGQIATAAISQTNFATAAAAAQAGASAGGGSGATAGAASGAASGGGISATTIGIIGAAVAGGAVAATQVGGGGSSDAEANTVDTFNGTMSGNYDSTGTCTSRSYRVSGTVHIELKAVGGTGKANVQVVMDETAFSGNCTAGPQLTFSIQDMPVSGGPSAIAFSGTTTIGQAPQIATYNVSFNGSQSGTTINGKVTINSSNPSGTGSAAATLSR